MATTTAESVSFADTDSRYDDMHSAIEAWIEELSELVDEGVGIRLTVGFLQRQRFRLLARRRWRAPRT